MGGDLPCSITTSVEVVNLVGDPLFNVSLLPDIKSNAVYSILRLVFSLAQWESYKLPS